MIQFSTDIIEKAKGGRQKAEGIRAGYGLLNYFLYFYN